MLIRPIIKMSGMPAKTRALLLNLLSIICWSIAPIMLRYVKEYFAVNFQNFFRYTVSLIILWLVFFITHGRERAGAMLRLIPPLFPKILLISLFKFIFQVFFIYSLYLIYPGVHAIIYQIGIVFSVFLAFLFFPDERSTLRSWAFRIGLIMAVVGVVLVVASGVSIGKEDFKAGVLMIVLSTVSWAMVGTLVRKWLPLVPPTLAVSTIFTVVTPLYFITYILLNGGFVWPEAPLSMWLVMIFSGIIGIGIGQTAYYFAINILGVALSASLGLLIPLLISILSFFVFGEVLSVWQLLGGAFLIGGSFLIIRVRFKHI